MTQSNKTTRINHIVVHDLPILKARSWFKPFSARLTAEIEDGYLKNIPEFTQKLKASNATSPAILAVWIKEAEQLGIKLRVEFVGSLLDPKRLLAGMIIWGFSKILNKVGIDRYKEMYNL